MTRALPATPGRWFCEEELHRSNAYHRPLRRAAQLADGGFAVLVVVLWVRDPAVAVTALVLAIAVVLRAVGGDLVMDRVAEPAIGEAPLPLGRLLISSVPVAVLRAGLVGALILAVDAAVDRPWLIGVVPVILVALALLVAEWWFDLVHRPTPAGRPSSSVVDEVASRLDVDPPHVQTTASPAFPGPTAMTLGVRRPRIVTTAALDGADPQLLEWVVTHEFAHVRRRDVLRGRVAAWLAVGAASVAASVTAASVDHSGTRTLLMTMGVGLMVWLVMQLGLMARSRHAERLADDVAAAVLGPRTAVVRALVSGPRARLDPTLWERMTAPHPTPAERLRRMTTR